MANYRIFKSITADGVIKDPDGALNKADFIPNIEFHHDVSQFTLSNPDTAYIYVGPPRLSISSSFAVVGYVNSISYTDSAQVTPLKAIGSQRHVFARANSPVTINIAKLVAHGPNLLRSLYKVANLNGTSMNNYTDITSAVPTDADPDNALWFSDLGSILFRIPFGFGVIYTAPMSGIDTKTEHTSIAGEYFEVCSIVNRSVGIQSGQNYIMENVAIMADRVVIVPDYTKATLDKYTKL